MTDFVFLNTAFGTTRRYSMAGVLQDTPFTGGDIHNGPAGTFYFDPSNGRYYTIKYFAGTHTSEETELGYWVSPTNTYTQLLHLVPASNSPTPGWSENTRYFGHVSADKKLILWGLQVAGNFTADPGVVGPPYSPYNYVWVHDLATGAQLNQRGPISASPVEVRGGKRTSKDLLFGFAWVFGHSDETLVGPDGYYMSMDPQTSGYHADTSVNVSLAAYSQNGREISFLDDSVWYPEVKVSDSSWAFWKLNAGGVIGLDTSVSGLPDPELNISGIPQVQVQANGTDAGEVNIYLLLFNNNTGVSSLWVAPKATLAFTHMFNPSTPFGGWAAPLIIAPWPAVIPPIPGVAKYLVNNSTFQQWFGATR